MNLLELFVDLLSYHTRYLPLHSQRDGRYVSRRVSTRPLRPRGDILCIRDPVSFRRSWNESGSIFRADSALGYQLQAMVQ